MKKFFTSTFLILLSLFLLVGCGANSIDQGLKQEDDLPRESNIDVNIASMKGPTTIGMAKIIQDYETNSLDFNLEDEKIVSHLDFHILTMPEEIVAGLSKGEIDLATIPANLAATIYNKTDGAIKVLSTNTLGVLHLVENGDSIENPQDLNGKTIYTVGKGTTPEAVLDNFIKANNLDLELEFKSEPAEILALLNQEEDIIAMIPEPFVSLAESKNQKIRRVFDMDQQWEKNNSSPMITGVLVARSDFIEENKNFIDGFLEEYERSIDQAVKEPETILDTVIEAGILPEAASVHSIKNCRLAYIDGEEMEDVLGKYLKSLLNFKEELIGGKLPGEDFYYKK